MDMGYRGHGYSGAVCVPVGKRRRERTAKALWRWMNRRAAIEPGIGPLKREPRMDRNRLKGGDGDRLDAILNASGMNFRSCFAGQRFFYTELPVGFYFIKEQCPSMPAPFSKAI